MKKVISVLLVGLFIVLALAGCGSKYSQIPQAMQDEMTTDGFPVALAMTGVKPTYSGNVFSFIEQDKKVKFDDIVSFYRDATATLNLSNATDMGAAELVEAGNMGLTQEYIDAGYKAWTYSGSTEDGSLFVQVQITQGLVQLNTINEVMVIVYDMSAFASETELDLSAGETLTEDVEMIEIPIDELAEGEDVSSAS